MQYDKVKSLGRVRLFAIPWTVAPPSMGFSRQEYWSGLPFPSPGDLPDPGIEPGSPALQADSLPTAPPGKAWAQDIAQHSQSQTRREEETFSGNSGLAIFAVMIFLFH